MIMTALKLEYDEDGGKVTREWHFGDGSAQPLEIAKEVSALIGQRIEESQKKGFTKSIGTCESCGGPIWPSEARKACSDPECASGGKACSDHEDE